MAAVHVISTICNAWLKSSQHLLKEEKEKKNNKTGQHIVQPFGTVMVVSQVMQAIVCKKKCKKLHFAISTYTYTLFFSLWGIFAVESFEK